MVNFNFHKFEKYKQNSSKVGYKRSNRIKTHGNTLPCLFLFLLLWSQIVKIKKKKIFLGGARSYICTFLPKKSWIFIGASILVRWISFFTNVRRYSDHFRKITPHHLILWSSEVNLSSTSEAKFGPKVTSIFTHTFITLSPWVCIRFSRLYPTFVEFFLILCEFVTNEVGQLYFVFFPETS